MNKLLNIIKEQSFMYHSEFHGINHWNRVKTNGFEIARLNGANRSIVQYFAVLHDCMRENEDDDPEHGARGAEFAKLHRDLIDLNDSDFEILCIAVKDHTSGKPWSKEAKNPTVAACWDGDRLDLPRVGIEVDPYQLVSDEGRIILNQRRKYNEHILFG